jgi:hypothetical protein
VSFFRLGFWDDEDSGLSLEKLVAKASLICSMLLLRVSGNLGVILLQVVGEDGGVSWISNVGHSDSTINFLPLQNASFSIGIEDKVLPNLLLARMGDCTKHAQSPGLLTSLSMLLILDAWRPWACSEPRRVDPKIVPPHWTCSVCVF